MNGRKFSGRIRIFFFLHICNPQVAQLLLTEEEKQLNNGLTPPQKYKPKKMPQEKKCLEEHGHCVPGNVDSTAHVLPQCFLKNRRENRENWF